MLDGYYSKHELERACEAFRSKGFAENWVIGGVKSETVDMASLPPFLRTLLVTDGTVTKSLEAYHWEPISVDTVFHEVVAAEAPIEWLDVRLGDAVIARRVNLRGLLSQTIYARAVSVIRPELIPEPVRSRLRAGSLGIGELIRDCGLETYRELLEIGLASGAAATADSLEDEVYRTYRITLSQRRAILVTEHFPLSTYASPAR